MMEFISIHTLIFMFLSICLCMAQSYFHRKAKFLTLCKVSVFLPLLSIPMGKLWGVGFALQERALVNDFSQAVMYVGLSNLAMSLAAGLGITIFLLVLYGVTAAICENAVPMIERE